MSENAQDPSSRQPERRENEGTQGAGAAACECVRSSAGAVGPSEDRPPPPSALLRGAVDVLQLSDLHVVADWDGGVRGVCCRESFAAVADAVRAQCGFFGSGSPAAAGAGGARARAPHCVLITGDVSDDGTAASYENVQRLLREAGIGECPAYFVPGNHDDPAEMQRTFPHAGAPHVCADRVVDLDGPAPRGGGGGGGTAERSRWRLVLLDSHLPVRRTSGWLAPLELALLEDALRENAASAAPRWVAVVLHHNIGDIGSPWFAPIGVRNADAFWAVVDRCPGDRVRAVVFGHIHQAFDSRRGPIRLLAAPGTSAQFLPRTRALVLDDIPPGFQRLRLLADGTVRADVGRAARSFLPPKKEVVEGGGVADADADADADTRAQPSSTSAAV